MTRCRLRAVKGTTAIENAASLLSSSIVRTVLDSTGSMIRMQEAHVPAGAFARPNVSGGSSSISWSIFIPF